MKFVIEGSIGKEKRTFKLELEANSEKHARELALVKMGSRNGLRKPQISIIKAEHKK